jgi:hypothetical protein
MPIVQGPHYRPNQHTPISITIAFSPLSFTLSLLSRLRHTSRQPEPLTQIRNLALKRVIRRIDPRLHLVQPSSDVDVLIEDRACGLFVVLFEAAEWGVVGSS